MSGCLEHPDLDSDGRGYREIVTPNRDKVYVRLIRGEETSTELPDLSADCLIDSLLPGQAFRQECLLCRRIVEVTAR